SRTFKRSFRRDAETNRRDACAPQKIIMHRFFYCPHCSATMAGKTIESAQLGQLPQLFFSQRNPVSEIFEGFERSGPTLALNSFAMFLPQSANNTKAEAKCVIGNNGASPIRLLDADRLNFEAVALGVLND